MSSFFRSLPKPRFGLQLHPKIDSLAGFDRFRRCASFAPVAEIASDRIKSFALFDTSTTRFCSRSKRRKNIFHKAFAEQEVDEFEIRKRSMDVEAEIYEFMQNSAKPRVFPTKQELIAAGRADLVDYVMALGGWLTFGWDINDNEVDDRLQSAGRVELEDGKVRPERATVTVLPANDEAAEDGRVYQERASNDSLMIAHIGSDGSEYCSSAPSSSGRSLETEDWEASGVEGILHRLEKERNLSFVTSRKVVNGQDSCRKSMVDRDEKKLVADKLNIQSNGGNTISESSECETCISQNDHINEVETKFKDVNGTKGAFPDTWRSWSLQRAHFSLTDFEAGEIVPNDDGRLSEDHPLDVEFSNKKFLLQEQNSTSYNQTDEKVVNESKIHSPLHLEVDLYSAAHILQARVDDATSQKQNSLYEQHILSDALEFQETEIIKARNMLKSIQAKSKVLHGKLSLEIREAQKILEMKQSKITVVKQPLSLLRATYIIWPNSASEVLLAGSFDGWTSQIIFLVTVNLTIWTGYTQRKMERSNSDTFSLQLKLYPGRFEIKFIVDGVWRVDPLRPTVNNNGHTNNLLVIE
ncbi:protein PTST homolog 2, chloroplastic-like isoform X1 [Zingiber officinale]|uniref:protein PTST homolog 2, chloroplastic-like isoform X1 n=1 Tax=Zingiber officinale TaxID=94328 RepID=UPI001C4C4975|nr:protein PTST homolog 2, chloroplastic-like isoform X1 [Zingiber officinale]